MKKRRILLFSVLLGLLIFIFVQNLFRISLSNTSVEKFSVEKWKSTSETQRSDMLDDMFKQYDFKNMTVSQVVELLGEGRKDSDSKYKKIRYLVGTAVIDYVFLEFFYDDNGKILFYDVHMT